MPRPASTRPTPIRTASDSGRSLESILIPAAMAAIGFCLLLVASVLIGTLWFGWRQWQSFSQASHLNWNQVQTILEEGAQTTVAETNGRKNFLILGVDSLAGRGNVPPLTDTMMLMSLNLKSGQINTLPLPRDIWSTEYQTKINSLYAYGLAQNPNRPTELPTLVISQLTGVPIHHTVVLSLEQVASIIDLLGGIEVDVQQGFVDPLFPRPDVDVTLERDPAKLYQAVSFTPGLQTMSGERALQFIRSRHSVGDEGDDVARGRRQQQVIAALMNRVQDPSQWFSAQRLGQLVALYQEAWGQALPLPELIATGQQLQPVLDRIELTSHALTIFPDDPKGVLQHPPTSPTYLNQWVYIIRQPEVFQAQVQQLLDLTTTPAATTSALPALP